MRYWVYICIFDKKKPAFIHVYLFLGHYDLMNAKKVKAELTVHTKPCPRCNSHIEKRGGCEQMFCCKCSTAFCWICGSIGYDHDNICDPTTYRTKVSSL